MALTSTLFTGLSGLDVNQTKLNVVGNNIANVNTVAFKASRALFKPQFYVTDSGGTPASGDFGGSNPSQRGLGAVIATIQKNFAPGAIEPTGKPTDLAVEGDGFFVVQGSQQKFTRDGSFLMNEANQLVSSSGDFVQGFGVDEEGNVIAGQLSNITIPLGSLTRAQPTEAVAFQGNLNANGPIATGATVLNSVQLFDGSGAPGTAATAATALTNVRDAAGNTLFATGDELTLAGQRGGRSLSALTYTIADAATETLGDYAAFLSQGLGIDPSVPVGALTPGVTVNGTGQLVVTGNGGADNALSLAGSALSSTNTSFAMPFTEDTATSTATGESVYTSFVAYDSLGTPITINMTAVLEARSDAGTTWRYFATSGDDTDAQVFTPGAGPTDGMRIGTGTISFDGEGKISGNAGTTLTVTRQNTGSATPLSVAVDFSPMTSLTDTTSRLFGEADGSPIGTLDSFSIGADGTISGLFTNGLTSRLGQVAMATFDNAQGLVDQGGNMFVTGSNSGEPTISTPLTLGAGAIRSGALELSNVDLSEEFINLIIASTGFSASSRVISTSDQLLTELLNASR
jgi:flagellar hook protein FlgE